jgi:hypothetical protein
MTNIVTTNSNINVVQVTSPGPLGPRGTAGPIGPPGTITGNSGVNSTGSSIFSGSLTVIGTLLVTGSNTFINIGPARFTGSVDISGSLSAITSSAQYFSGSGAGLFNIPASAISGLNISTFRIATGSVSASVNTGGTSFTLNSGVSNLFTVSNSGLGTFANGLTVNGAVANLNNGLNVSTGNTVINSPVIQLIGSATLNGQPITTAGDLTLDKIKSGIVTASVSTGANSFILESGGTTLFAVSNTGILSGSGANLFNIPASGITGLNLSQIGSGSFTASIADNKFRVNTNSEITGSLIVTAGISGSFSGSGANLFNIPASGITGLNLSQIATGSISASANVGSTSFQIVSGSSTLLTVDNTGLATISSSINIGRPSDGSYTTGFFDTFTTTTKVSDAIDEISAAFLDLAPAKAGTLTSQTLTLSSPSTFTGYLAGGLNSADWYVGASAHQAISSLVSSTSVVYATPSTSTIFRAGKYSNLSPSNVLEGGVSASIASGSQTLAVYSTRALSAGTGLTGAINITSLAQYNTFWVKANAQIQHTLTTTGSYKYSVTADNAAGTTNTSQLWYVGGAGDFPTQAVTADTPITSSTTFNYLSGVPYLKTATFTLGITGSNLFNPVYNQNQVSFTSTYFSTLTTGSNSPNYNDTLRLNVTRTLTANLSSGQTSPTGTVTVSKPNKSNQSTSYTLAAQKVNSYSSAQSTNTTEPFLDEARRYGDFQTTSWTSINALTDGNLQVQNGRLIDGRAGDYAAFTATTQEYFRALTVTSFTAGGTHTFTVSGFSSVSQWGSGGELEISFVKAADVTGAKTASTVWDFGRAFGNNSGNIKGIVVSGTGLSGTFSLGTDNSGNGSLILYIKYNGVTTAKVISQFTVSM